jgi:hypothetical protein
MIFGHSDCDRVLAAGADDFVVKPAATRGRWPISE